MYCLNAKHQAQSPYSTNTNNGGILWTNNTIMGIESSPTIAADGTIYFGSYHYLYAFSNNGTHKWTFTARLIGTSSFAIGGDGTIYFGTEEDFFYAVNPNGTLRWIFPTQSMIDSQPVIDQSGTIYFGTIDSGKLYALLPNGTEKWDFTTQDAIFTSPAVGSDGTIYCSSNDNHLYAVYPNNGTLKWSVSFGNFIGSPTIANNGMIYEASWDGYLYAINSDGIQSWKSAIGTGCAHCPSIASDGTIYIGADKLYAITPEGVTKWSFDAGPGFSASSDAQAISSDGTIYYAVSMGSQRGDIIAVNPDGTQKWRETIANEWVWSSPAIAKDGTVYIGSTSMGTTPYGVLYAFNGKPFDPITIDRPKQGKLYFFNNELGSTISGNTICIGPITIQAIHPAPDEVIKVDFFLDGKKQTSIQTPPYQWTYSKFSLGKHSITVIATNRIGAVRSDSISIWKLF
jgi:outer membrane protein assembly factor BamB